MFYWEKAASRRGEPGDQHEGEIRESGREDRVIGIYRYAELGYRIFALPQAKVTPTEYLRLINLFVEKCEAPFPKERGVIVVMDPSEGEYRDTPVPLPLTITDGRFNGVPIEKLSCLRLDVPAPMAANPPTTIRPGEVIDSIGPRGVLGLSFFAVLGQSLQLHNVCVADAMKLPADLIVDYYAASVERILSSADRSSLIDLIAAHGRPVL